MKFFTLLLLKIKNTLRYKHNLLLLTALPALAAAGAWALLAFYIEGGANIPVGVLDYDKSEFSETAISRFAKKSAVGVVELQSGDADYWENDIAYHEARRFVQTGVLEALLIVKPGFSDNLHHGNPEGVFAVVSSPVGVARGIVAELFAAQVSRLYFNCDAANRVVRDSMAAARAARLPPLTDSEIGEIFEKSYAYCDSYWEPQPLMTVEYERYDIERPAAPNDITGAEGAPESGKGAGNAHAAAGSPAAFLPGAKDGWQDLRDMLNDLMSRAVYAILITYAAICMLNAAGVMTVERADGVLTRMRAQGFGAWAWIAVSAAAPFILYGAPCAVLLAYLSKNVNSAAFCVAALLCISAIGASAAYILKKPGRYRIFMILCSLISAGTSMYFM